MPNSKAAGSLMDSVVTLGVHPHSTLADDAGGGAVTAGVAVSATNPSDDTPQLLGTAEYVPGDLGLASADDATEPSAANTASHPQLGGTVFMGNCEQLAKQYGLELKAAVVAAMLTGIPGLMYDNGKAYGPWALHLTDGRVKAFDGKPPYTESVNVWAWSRVGLDYAFRNMAKTNAKGGNGNDALKALVYEFLKPKAPQTMYQDAVYLYGWLDTVPGGWRKFCAGEAKGPQPKQPTSAGPEPPHAKAVGINNLWRQLGQQIGPGAKDIRAKVKTITDNYREVFK